MSPASTLTSALFVSEARACDDSIASSKVSFLLDAFVSVSWSRVNNSTSDLASSNTFSLLPEAILCLPMRMRYAVYCASLL